MNQKSREAVLVEDAVPEEQIVENSADDQPYPVFGWLDIRWHRPDGGQGGP